MTAERGFCYIVDLRQEPFLVQLQSAGRNELRLIYRVFGKTDLINLIPKKAFDIPRSIAKYIFGTDQSKLLNEILDDTDLKFSKWAIKELINWENEQQIENCIKINGTKDKLISASKTNNTRLIIGGEHFMIVDKAKEISEIINDEINQRHHNKR